MYRLHPSSFVVHYGRRRGSSAKEVLAVTHNAHKRTQKKDKRPPLVHSLASSFRERLVVVRVP